MPSHRGGAARGRFAGAKICSGPIVGKKVAKTWWLCWCAGLDARWRSSRCAAGALHQPKQQQAVLLGGMQ